MAQDISITAFEKNAARSNKSGLARSFNTILDHMREYVPALPLSATKKLMFEVTIDKDSVDDFIKLIKDNGFEFIGSTNYYYVEEAVKQYEANPRMYNVKPDMMEALKKDVKEMKEKNTDAKDIENDDKVFYFIPVSEGVNTLYEFIKTMKDKIYDFAKANDITIMIKISGYNNQISGFLGFNFFDADKKDEEVVIDYASRITVGVDFKSRQAVFSAAMYLNAIGESEEELYDADVNTHIVTEKATNANGIEVA